MAYNYNTGMYEGYIYKIYNDINDKLYIGQTTATIADRWHGHMSAALNEKRCKSALYNAMRKYGRDKFHMEEIKKVEFLNFEELVDELNMIEQEFIKNFDSLVSKNGYNIELGGNNKRVPGRIVHKYDINLNYLETYTSCNEAGRANGIDGSTVYNCCHHDYYTAGGFVWSFDGEVPVKPDYTKRKESLNKLAKLRKKKNEGASKSVKKYISKKLPEEIKRANRLKRLNWSGEQIYVYNAFGEIIDVYEDLIDAIVNIPITAQELHKNLNGENLKYKNMVIRYANDPFNKFPMSIRLQPITVYDIQGNIVKFCSTIFDAEKFVGASQGEVLKSIKRGGSCCGFMFSFYGEPLKRKILSRIKSIEMLDIDYKCIRVFNTIVEINNYFDIKDCHHALNKAIKNNVMYRGHYWRYKDEFAINA